MASITLRNDRLPSGTSVGVYPGRYRLNGEAPTTDPIDTVTVAADGSLTVTGLAEAASYVAYAQVSGEHRYVGFRTNTPPRDSDGTDGSRFFGGGPDQSPEYNTAALIDAIENGGCVNLGVSTADDPIVFAPDDALTMRQGVTVRGVPGQTFLRSSEYLTESLFTITESGWQLLDVILDGGAQLAAGGTPSIMVIDNCSEWTFRGSLRNGYNNGAVIRGPGIKRFRFEAHECQNFGTPGQIGGGHVVAISGDGLGLPFDSQDGYVWMDGWNINNGGVNVGSSYNIEAHVRVRNDYDPTVGPPDSGYAALRLANGSRRVVGTVHGIGVGRCLRIGPCDEATIDVYAEETSFEPVLLDGSVYTFAGWRGGRNRIRVRSVNGNLLAGEDVVRSRSHGPTTVTIDAYNRAGLTALRGMISTIDPNDPDLVETVTKKVLHIRWDTFDDYVFKITSTDAGATITWQAVSDDGLATVAATVGPITNTNDALAAAINGLGGIFTANYINGPSHALELSTAGRKGPSSHLLRVADLASVLAGTLNAGETTSSMHIANGAVVANSPNGETHYPFWGEIRNAATNNREVVQVLSRDFPLIGNTFSIKRAQKGTTALAWDTTATFYAHPSEIYVEHAVSRRMSLDSINVTGPASFCDFNTFNIRTDESNVRASGSGTLFVPYGLRTVHVSNAAHIQWITGGFAGRELIVIADVNGVILDHAATRADGNLKLSKASGLTINATESVMLKWDDNADQVREVGMAVR